MLQLRIAHIAASGKLQLLFLKMELCIRKPVKIARVIIVKMRQNNIINRIGSDAEIGQSLDRALNEIALAFDRHFGGKASINHHNMII